MAKKDKTNKHMMDAIRKSEEKYRDMFENAMEGIFQSTPEGVFLSVNPAFVKMYGFESPEEMLAYVNDIAKQLYVNPEERGEFKKVLEEHGSVNGYVAQWYRKDGTIFSTSTNARKVCDSSGKILYYQGTVEDITQRREMEELLVKERETFYSILQKAPYGVVLSDKDGKYTYINPEFTAITGYTLEDIPTGRDWFHKAFPMKRTRDEIKKAWKADIPVRGTENIFSIVCKDGQTKEINFRTTMLDDGRAITMLSDITERKQAEELFKNLAYNSPVGVYIVQAGRLKFVNPHFERITGYKESELLDKDAMILVMPDDRNLTREHVLGMLKGEIMSAYEARVLRKTGEMRWILQSITSIQFKGKPAVLGSFVDITEKKQMEEKLHTMSIIDELTQLYNRRGFFTLAAQQMKISSRNKKEMLLFFIDLDGLKWINDTSGHQEGDLALIGTANILRDTFRDADVIGRIGGDEFAILAVDTSEKTGTLLEKRLQERIDLYNNEIEKTHRLSMSVGVAVYNPECPSTIDELMSKADTSMYEEKKRKRSRQEFTR